MPEQLSYLIPIAAFILVFPLFWMGVVGLVARLGGWHSLTHSFKTDRPPEGETINWTSGKFSFFSSYNHCLNVTVSSRGVRIEPNLLFRFGHPPLFFPWTAIAGLTQQRMLIAYISVMHVGIATGSQPITLYGRRVCEALAKYAPAELTAPPIDARGV